MRAGAGHLGGAAGGVAVNDGPGAGMVARTRWLRLARVTPTLLLEVFVYLVVMAVCITVAMHAYFDARIHLAAAQAAQLARTAEVAMIEFRAVSGDWPASNSAAAFDEPQLRQDRHGSADIRAGGAVDIRFPRDGTVLADQVLSLRAWQGPDSASPVAWLCGHAVARALVPASADRTTMRDRDLPAGCRGG